MTTSAEYSSPLIYESEYGGYTDDFDIFCDTVTKGEALDIACGTERITLKLVEIGLKCIGIDTSDPILKIAKEKARNHGIDITYLNVDMRNFNLNKKFDLLTMAGNSFQALLTEKDQFGCLSSIASHMHDKSLFIMNTRNATSDEMRTTEKFEHWHDFIDDKNQLVKVYGIQVFDPKTNIVKYTTKRSWQSFETLTEIELKFTNFSELSKILKQSGFEILETYGDFMKTTFDPVNSKDIILICKRTL
ncbi:MAG: class I SAM-dependent methyltransferase [Proteobacteria bacterium]|nr:class I SAM-dependent methyltransferase [Pseudomonadota bacterium]